MNIGYKLCSEEHGPRELVEYARRAEDVGFTFAMISDHFHPWIEKQGQSSFVWGALGGIAYSTERLKVGTGVTCPTIRIHPAIIAQAAATAAAMMPGRFMLGVGSGENLNEHITGQRWPPVAVRQEMLEEAIEIIRLLWQGGEKTHRGKYYVVENAQIFTLPKELPPILIAAGGPKSSEMAGRVGDGLITTNPDKKLVDKFRASGGGNKPVYGEMTVCWAKDETEARRVALECWPTSGLNGALYQELATPDLFRHAVKPVTEEAIAKEIVCGPDPRHHIESITRYADAGFDGVWVHQVGPNQEGFFKFYDEEVMPKLTESGLASSATV